jgi:hypothetical protein
MITKIAILQNPILLKSKTKFPVVISKPVFFLNYYISGIFSLASIKKPLLILINKTSLRVALLTKTKNSIQR